MTVDKIDDVISALDMFKTIIGELSDINIDVSGRCDKPALIVNTPREFIILKRKIEEIHGCFPLEEDRTFDVPANKEKIYVYGNKELMWEIWFVAPIEVPYDSFQVLRFFDTVYGEEAACWLY